MSAVLGVAAARIVREDESGESRTCVRYPVLPHDPRLETCDATAGMLPCISVPLLWPDGCRFGVIDFLDAAPRAFSDPERSLIEHGRTYIEEHLASLAEDAGRVEHASLQVERERLILAARATQSGIWDFNIDTGALYCDARWHEIIGIDPSAPVSSLDEFKPHIHPDDVERATEVTATMSELIAAERDYQITFRIIRPTGEVRWVSSTACIIDAGPESPRRAVGAIVDVTGQTQALQALVASELRFKTLVETVPQAIFSAQPDGMADYINKRWYQFTGVRNTPISNELWERFLHPEDRESTLGNWRQSLATGKRYDAEFRYQHRSGEFRWLHVVVVPMRDSDGRITRWFGSATDIHAAKLHGINRELLARELDHRIRNIFALVNGLIGISARDAPDMAPLAERLRARLDALNKAHSVIGTARSAARASTVQDLLVTLLAPYESTDAPRILMQGEPLRIQESAVTSMALIFHELATNSAKYGVLNTAQGQLHLAVDCAEDRINIVWREAGIQQPASVDHAGFGSNLVNRLVQSQLQGQITRQWSTDGLLIHLSIPAQALAVPPGG